MALVLVAGALFAAPYLKAFRDRTTGQPWGTGRSMLSKALLIGQATLYLVANAYVFLLLWAPAYMKDSSASLANNTTQFKSRDSNAMESVSHDHDTGRRELPSWLGPLVAMGCFAFGMAMWVWVR